MTDQTETRVDEQVWTDTGTGAVAGPSGPTTVDLANEDEGPTGAVPGPPASVTTYDFPYDADGNLLPTARPAEPDTKQVTAAEVEDKGVRRGRANH